VVPQLFLKKLAPKNPAPFITFSLSGEPSVHHCLAMRTWFSTLLALHSLHAELPESTPKDLTDNRPVKTYKLTHPSGISATVSDFGATLRTLSLPDRDGKIQNILVGFEKEQQWLNNQAFFGSTVGRYANRIAGGEFSLDGETYKLATNNGPNHLHGGINGFDKIIWETEAVSENSVKFTHLSPDGDEGYPGNLRITVGYTLQENSLTWKATATADKATPINLTNHAYFNLTGDPKKSILNHILKINASEYLPVDASNIPTGEIKPVAGTSFDFRSPVEIGTNLRMAETGFDHNFVLEKNPLSANAIFRDPASGRTIELSTDQPGLQFYLSSPFGNESSALCLEPQKFPNSPNQPNFPSSILRHGETYSHTLTLRFPKPD